MTWSPILYRHDDHTKAPYARTCLPFSSTMDSMVNKGLKEYTPFNTQSQHFDHVKKKDTRLRQILVNHHIATSPESSQT